MSETARETDRPRAGRSAANADPPGTVGELLAATEDSEEAEPEPGMERMREAARGAAAQAEETGGLGRLGQPMNRRSPFFIGMAGAAGVAVTIGLVELVTRARSVLVIIGLALFIAVGMDPRSELADQAPGAAVGGRDHRAAGLARGGRRATFRYGSHTGHPGVPDPGPAGPHHEFQTRRFLAALARRCLPSLNLPLP